MAAARATNDVLSCVIASHYGRVCVSHVVCLYTSGTIATNYPRNANVPLSGGDATMTGSQDTDRTQAASDAQDSAQPLREETAPGDLSVSLGDALGMADDAARRAQAALATVQSVAQRLRVMEDRLHAMAAASSSINWLTTGDGLMLDAPEWRQFTGQSVEQARGWGWLDVIHPDDRERVMLAWREALQQRLPYTNEFRVCRSDGVYRDFLAQAAPIYEDDGSVREWVGVCIDISRRKRLERDLLASERKYRSTFEQAATGIAHIAPDGRIVLVNERFCRLLGYSREELLARNAKDFTHPDDIDQEAAHMRELLVGADLTYTLEKRYLARDGGLVWANITCSLVRDGEGQPLYFISVAEDISERKRLERGLADNVAQLEAIFEAMGDAVFVYDESGQPTRTNSAASDIYGSAPDSRYFELPREERRKLLPAYDLEGHPLAAEQRPAARALRGEAFRGDDAQDVRLRTFDGRERDLNFTGAPIRRGNQIVGAVVVARDVTERRRLERVAREAERRAAAHARELEAALQAMTDGVAIYDTAGHLRRMNRAAALFLALNETGGGASASTGGALTERADVALIRRLLDGCDRHDHADTGGVCHTEMPFRGLDGRERDLSLTGATIRDDEGQVTGAIIVARDVTERNRLERQRTDMLQMVGHDLASPLQAAQVYVQRRRRMLAPADGEEREAQALSAMEHSLRRIERLVGDLQLAARIELGTLRLTRTPTDLVALARAEAELAATVTGRAVRLDAPSEPALADVDASRIGQSLANLLGNAHKYSPRDRLIELRLTTEKGLARISVTDTGPGIPPGELWRVWEQFHQVKEIKPVAGSGGGLGLGLFITRNVIEAHGGAVGVESIVGEGSTFWFTLPLLPPEA